MGIVDDERKAATLELAAAVTKKAEGHQDILKAIARCKEADISITAIADTIGCHRGTVYEWLAKPQSAEEGTV